MPEGQEKQAQNFRHIEEESNRYAAARILQQVGKQTVVTNPPYPPMTQGELDMSFDLPYTRLPHPKYKNKRIPAYEMIKFSVNIHGDALADVLSVPSRLIRKVHCQPKQGKYSQGSESHH